MYEKGRRTTHTKLIYSRAQRRRRRIHFANFQGSRVVSNNRRHVQRDVAGNVERRRSAMEFQVNSHRSKCILEPGGSFCHSDSLVPWNGTIFTAYRTRAEYRRSSDKMAVNVGISRRWGEG